MKPSEEDRTRALLALRDRYARGDETVEELSDAVERVLSADTLAEIEAVAPRATFGGPAESVPWSELAEVEQQLLGGEEVVWVGRPQLRVWPRRNELAYLAFTSMIAMLVVFWEVFAIANGLPVGALVFGAVLVIASLSFALRPFAASALRRTLYAVTTRRVMRISHGLGGTRADGVELRALPRLSVNARRSGVGTVSFGEAEPLEFADVPEAAAVARLVQSLQAHERG